MMDLELLGMITEGLHLRLKDVYSKDPDAYSTSDFDWWPDEFLTDNTCIPILTAGDREYPAGVPDEWKTEEDILKNARRAPCCTKADTVFDVHERRPPRNITGSSRSSEYAPGIPQTHIGMVRNHR